MSSRFHFSRFRVRLLMMTITILTLSTLSFGQDDDVEPATESHRSGTSDGPGVLGRAGFLGGSTFGRDDSIAPIQVMPYMLFDPHFVFADVRLFVSTQGNFGGNLGGGYRYLDEDHQAWYGANAWIDVDETSGKVFPQLGLGLEAAWTILEARSNFYLPIGDRDQVLENSAINTRYAGYNILFDQFTTSGKSLAGLDGEVGFSWPVEALDRALIVRGFVGGYHFNSDGGTAINGFRTRSEVVISSSVVTQIEYTSDDVYGQNLMVGLSLEWPFGEDHPGVEWRRPTPSPFRFVQRNYNVILDRTTTTANNVVAINSATSQPYFIQHVDSNAGTGGDGTVENPYRTFAPATEHAADIIFVHAGSALHETLVLPEDTRVLGDNGLQHFRAVGWGDLLLPSFSAGVAAPIITDVSGDAVVLSSGSEFSGFTIENISGDGLHGTHVTDLLISNVSLRQIHGDAVDISNAPDGTVTLTNLALDEVSGRGLAFTNLDAKLVVSESTFNNVAGSAILIDGGAGDAYFLGDTTITGTNSQVAVRNTAGHVEFAGLELTGNSGAPLLSLAHITGDVEVASLALENTNGAGLIANAVDSFTITKGTIDTTHGAALDLTDTDITAVFSEIHADGGTYGLKLTRMTGGLVISGGTLENLGTAALFDDVGSVQLTSLTLTDNGIGIQSHAADYLQLSQLTVTGTTGYAIDSRDDALLSVQSSTFSDNGTLDQATIRVRADSLETYRSEFLDNTVTDTRGTPLLFATAAGGEGATLSTVISGNTFTASRGNQSGIKVEWNGPLEITVSGNEFDLTGASMTGISLSGLSTLESLAGTITANQFAFDGSHSVGIGVHASGTSELSVTSNTVTFDGTGGIGLRFDFADAAQLWVSTNVITDQAGAATGMLFDNVATLSKLQIENNQLDLTSSSSSVDRGIIFTDLDDDVELFGTYNNLINSATDAFYMPTRATTGGFYVNGTLVP